ncbi:DUF4345 domain-containing protein [Pontibacter sp. BT310]|uniref:DUF4345 domain-containing protein n=1 Tax=Pontibacter populi TaxID=890055 RepID=A0ABS6XDW3_9BACT|nr:MULTISPECIES: DUF4345 domain-containing protein [Pontibacter]MBJ6119238.1 DUF4345 domain-containing protein [Pontibacter sp. BT310]MBR0571666.1 DUF4345 domain-containing protein [Microvirga sp. STS03]MBW3366092.1 DUF4345 domain-containing protein [Pontibacter populi]
MKTQRTIALASKGFILLSALSLLSVSVMAFANPQSVMDLVHVQLNNTDAFSSIRGVYGGVGMTLFLSLIYLMLRDTQSGLLFLCLLWGFYALSRTITIFSEGALGDFGNQWLMTESVFFVLALALAMANRKAMPNNKAV